MGFFLKNRQISVRKKTLNFFSKSLKVANLLQNGNQFIILPKNLSFLPELRFFAEISQIVNLEQLSKIAEDRIFCKKAIILLKKPSIFLAFWSFQNSNAKRKTP